MTETPKSPLYTATGDAGTTSLVGGMRAPKHSVRIEAYGTVDELNSHLGLLLAQMPDVNALSELRHTLTATQHHLFNLGSALATPVAPGTEPRPGVTEAQIEALERAIDRADAAVPPLRQFVLPAGSVAAAQAHVARTVCRRAERRITALAQAEPVSPMVLRYVNRLSDLLFAAARLCNTATSTPEVAWNSSI